MIKNITLLKIGQWIIWISFLIWFIQTIYFQITEGWHWNATNYIELFLDEVFSLGLHIGTLFYGIAIVSHVVDEIVRDHETKKIIQKIREKEEKEDFKES